MGVCFYQMGGSCQLYTGHNFHFNVREHAMACTWRAGATIFTFSDYLRPSLRLAEMDSP
ncbi:MAG: hypothetical protein PHH91_11115 [Desulfuromonadaceae bacterium]|nr:hypothetical protein [Desulfuromonadaceae bacterium]